jgi:FkbM family methyltransferase
MRSIRESVVTRVSRFGAGLGPSPLRRWMRGTPTLSLVCVCGSPPQQVRAFLETWRPLVAEVVLAVEQDRATAILDVCGDLADRTFLLPAAHGPLWMERYLGWLHEQCRGDWILRADDDELPSEALRQALAGLLDERELTHLWLPRRWVFPDSSHQIAQGLWLRDVQLRLVRNVPGVWQLSGARHSNLMVQGAGRITDAGLLHLDSLIKPHAARRAKIEEYRGLLGEMVSGGYRIFEVYDPEAVPDLALVELADADRETIDQFRMRAGAAPAPHRRRSRQPEPVSSDSINSWVGVREVSAGAYAAQIRLPYPVEPMPAGVLRQIQVEVTNTSSEWWPRGPSAQPHIRIGHTWRDGSGAELAVQTPRTEFTERVAPGALTRLMVAIQAPPQPGCAELEIDLVHELVRWFHQPLCVKVDITEADVSGVRFSLRGVDLEFGEWTTPTLRASFESGSYEGLEAAIVETAVGAEDRVVEIGCGTGFITTIAARTGAQVWAYDANPRLVDIARATLERNGVTASVTAATLQRAPTAQTVPFYVHRDFWTSSLAPAPGAERIEVHVLDFTAEIMAHRASCLIVDIEGAEVDLLTGPIPDCVEKVCVECHPDATGSDAIRAMLMALLSQRFTLDLKRSRPPVVYLERSGRAANAVDPMPSDPGEF